MVKKFLAFISVILIATPVWAQSDETSGRASIYEFLNIPVNPRAAAMGNAFVAMKNDQNTLFSNPAALATLQTDSLGRSHKVSAGFLKHVLDINEGFVSFGAPTDTLLGVEGGMLVANPVPEAAEIPREEMEIYIARALDNAENDEITGKAVTPYLLSNLFEMTEGRSLETNIALVENNARLAGEIAVALNAK